MKRKQPKVRAVRSVWVVEYSEGNGNFRPLELARHTEKAALELISGRDKALGYYRVTRYDARAKKGIQ